MWCAILSVCEHHINCDLAEWAIKFCNSACFETVSIWGSSRRVVALQILGFPVQLIGVAALPYFYVKYVIEGDSLVDDVGAAAVSPYPIDARQD